MNKTKLFQSYIAVTSLFGAGWRINTSRKLYPPDQYPCTTFENMRNILALGWTGACVGPVLPFYAIYTAYENYSKTES